MTAVTPTGWCAWCGRQWALNTDGHLRAHRAAGLPEHCLGAGRRPTVILRTPRTSPAAAARHRAELLAALADPSPARRQASRRPRKATT